MPADDEPTWITAEQLAQAFDVPPEILGLPPVDPVSKDKTPLSNHSSGLAMDLNRSSNPYMGKPIPGKMYLEGNGDPFEHTVKPYMVFDVAGKANPVVVTPPQLKIWQTELGQIDQQGDVLQVSLHGTVSTAQGLHEVGAQIVMTDLELAKKLIGVIPNEGPGTGIQVLDQAAGSELFTWEAGTGWIPKQPLYAAFPEVSTKTNKLPFTAAPPPLHVPEEGTKHTGPDGTVWEFRLKGGWRVPTYTYDPKTSAVYGWFCTTCQEHMLVHKGDPVACDSGGWCRPATSAEHKLAQLRAAG